ncbi:MAG: hypothetical protein JJT94_11690 [Bernardetiaceae bacterium]|nr:hypothetical protein [Bernardetiaceae bacterium]
MSQKTIKILEEKIEALQEDWAITANTAQKFQLKKEIERAKEELATLKGEQPESHTNQTNNNQTSTNKKVEIMTVEDLKDLAQAQDFQTLLDALDKLFEQKKHYSYSQMRHTIQFALQNGGLDHNKMQALLVFLGSNEVRERLKKQA